MIVSLFFFTLECDFIVEAADNTRIHILSLTSMDAILLESNGRFGMIDSGEDSDYPDGSDPRYPLRGEISKCAGCEEDVIRYMKSVGVTAENFEFYIGTHPHSDHIGTADDVIREFTPERVYIMEYADEYIMTEWGLYDNLYVYNQMIEAAKEVGAVLIQNFSPDAPVTPVQGSFFEDPALPEENRKIDDREAVVLTKEEVLDKYGIDAEEMNESRNPEEIPEEGVTVIMDTDPNSVEIEPNVSTTGNPKFSLGDMQIEIMNYSDDYKTHPKPDANYFSLGVKVSAHGKSAFFAGDIGAYDGDEIRLAPIIGKIDVLKLGHHGAATSSTEAFLQELNPEIAIQTGDYYYLADGIIESLDKIGTRLYTTGAYKFLYDAIIIDFSGEKIITNIDGTYYFASRNESPVLTYYENGLKTAFTGFGEYLDGRYYFDGTCYALEDQWITVDGNKYYLQRNGKIVVGQWIHNGYANEDGIWTPDYPIIQTGWVYDSGKWYYYDSKGDKSIGWRLIENTWYYMDSNGVMLNNQWEWIDGKCYFFSESGALLTDQWISGYYVNASGAWVPDRAFPKAGWKNERGTWYYINTDGNKATGWNWINGAWYFFNDKHLMVTGLKEINGAKYYFADSGAMVTGWSFLDEKWYYFESTGKMYTGWFTFGGKWYYLDTDGHMCTNQWVDGGYYVNDLGIWVPGYIPTEQGWKNEGDKQYYYDTHGQKVTGWKMIKNKWYYFYYSGIMASDQWLWDGNKCYYFAVNGEMVTSQWVMYEEKYYYLAEDGHMLTNTWIGDAYVDGTGAKRD